MRAWIALSFSRAVVRRAVLYAMVVGAVLIAINHGDAVLRGEIDVAQLLKMGLTVMVPYSVPTLSSVSAIRSHQTEAKR